MNCFDSGAAPTMMAPKLYCRRLQVKRKKACTKMAVSSTSFRSNTRALVRAANGISCTRPLALSVAPSAASRPPMIRMLVDAKNEGLADRLCATAESTMRFSRKVACSIQRRRHWLVVARIDGVRSARCLAHRA